MFRALILGPLFAILSTLSAYAQEVVAPEPAIEATISGQIDAFLEDDFDTAFTFASPMIRGLFRTPENFGLMVRQGYPMVHRPQDVTFGDLTKTAGGLWQNVIVTDATGRVHVLAYKMIETDAGWRIDGVQILRQQGFAA